ncbi:MAG TPA: phosphate ABC transporter permease PstA [Terriglobales bacterium]|nr:phosphate ABC transporter permease PstA [Terriglobales bacterium]
MKRPGRSLSLRRKLTSRCMLGLCGLCSAVVLLPLLLLLFYVARQGAAGLNWAFFTQLPAPPGASGGGMANAIVGTLELLGIAFVLGVPLGMAGGVYVSELANEHLVLAVRFAADALNGIPTIVTGIFVYSLVVVRMHRFSGLAGGLALAIVMLPVVLRASDEVLRLVPHSYREAALALGATRWRVVRDIILRAAKRGLVGAALLGVARVAGETAPLLLTALGSSQWSLRLDQPVASLTMQIYSYAIAPYDDWHRQAWAGALTLIAMIVVTSAAARAWVGRRT